MLDALVTFAATAAGEESSQAAFYIAGLVLTGWALLVSLLGMSRKRDWPGSESVARGVMGISAVLVLATMASAVLSS